jgi:hypothetical protein
MCHSLLYSDALNLFLFLFLHYFLMMSPRRECILDYFSLPRGFQMTGMAMTLAAFGAIVYAVDPSHALPPGADHKRLGFATTVRYPSFYFVYLSIYFTIYFLFCSHNLFIYFN